MLNHPSRDVRESLKHLLDALCTWERNTGQESVLILRESSGRVCRAKSGKPVIEETSPQHTGCPVSDVDLLAMLPETEEA